MDALTQAQINSLNTQMRQNSTRIEALRQEVAALRDRLDKVAQAQVKYGRAVEGFQTDGYNARRTASDLEAMRNVKLAQRFAESMTGLMTGPRYKSADMAVGAIGEDLKRERTRLEREIEAKESEMRSLQSLNSSLYRQVCYLSASG